MTTKCLYCERNITIEDTEMPDFDDAHFCSVGHEIEYHIR